MSDFYRNRRVLVLGGLGFIGSNLALELVERGAAVTVVDSLFAGLGGNPFNIEPVRDRISVHNCDIRDAPEMAARVEGQDVIFSLAGQVSHILSMRDPLTDQDVNCRGQLTILECCRRHNPAVKIVFASTRQLYGRPQYLPVDERHPVAPVDANGVSKHAAEMYYTLYHKLHGIRCVTLRLTNTYGPRLNLRGAGQGFVSVFLRKALMKAPIDVFGTGRQRRDFNFVDDVVEAFLLAGEHERLDGMTFNLGHPRNFSILELVDILKRHAAVDYRCIDFPPDRAAIDVGDYYGDFSRFRQATGWTPRCDLETGIAATLEYFRRYPDQYLGPDHDSHV